MKVIRANSKNFQKLVERNCITKKRVSKKVSEIIETVRTRRSQAVVEYTKKFDRVKMTTKDLRVSEREINASFGGLDSSLILALKTAMDNVFRFYRKQVPKNFKLKSEEGLKVEEKFVPIERVGIYIPGGQAPLVSSVYMCAIPAIIAGVKEIVLASPPDRNGFLNPYILATASILRIKEIYKMGGAQAIAALSLGTETILKVDKVVGPGNEYVTEAKRQLFGVTGVDLLAGPSEVVIVAGRKANIQYIVKDLEAQTEHRKGLGVVITLSKSLFKQLKKCNIPGAYLIGVNNLDEAADLVNKLAPEHLELMLRASGKFIKKVKHSGAIFVGDYSPVVLGDYIAGPSHVLPTGATSRFFSGLSVHDFFKRIHIVSYSKKALVRDFEALEKIASLENMKKHIESVRARLS